MKLASRLLRWYRANGRKLPWRETTDPYRILVSEIMLQQTQVSRVLIFYEKWLARFPNWNTLAAASNAEVIRAWAGLGYNRRALMLRDIARAIAQEGVPESEEEWLQLKGIGPYTAAALAVFSLRQKSIPIDTNIRRTLGRLLFGKPYPQPTDDLDIRRAGLRTLSSSKTFYDIPQALFDLATLHCTKLPNCVECPFQTDCKASKKFLSGRVTAPKQMVKKPAETIWRNKKYPDRIYRGRILKAVRENGSIATKNIGSMIDATYEREKDQSWVMEMIERLERDGMIRQSSQRIELAD